MNSLKSYRCLVFFLAFILCNGCNPFSEVRSRFIDNFDLQLVGKVTDVQINKYSQKVVCLDVLESNHNEYFPIYDPNNVSKEGVSNLDKRFFIKVEGDKAIFIFRDNNKHRYITQHIIEGAIIKVNENNNKSFEVYDFNESKKLGGLKIQTSPIRDNIEISCLANDSN